MKTSTSAVLCLAIGGCSVLPATAQEAQWAFGVSGGTLGVGPQLSYRATPHLGLRANATFLSVTRDETVDDIEYDGDLDLRSFGAMLDWYPTGGALRISFGGRINETEVGLSGTPAAGVTIGDSTYAPEQVGSLTGTVRVDDFAPALTIGYGGTLGRGFTFGAEIGVLWQGAASIENLRATGPLAAFPQLQADIEREEQRIEDELEEYELWPIAQLEFQYRF